jgi:hypothetical protein
MEFKPSFMPFKHGQSTNDCRNPGDFFHSSVAGAPLSRACAIGNPCQIWRYTNYALEFLSHEKVELLNFDH